MSAYAQHLATLTQRLDRLLPRCGFDHLLIPAGVEKYNFLDDTHSPFKVNPHFKAWLPLTQHPHSWISYTPGSKPVLVYFQPDDYWHLPPSDPHGDWVQHFDIRIIREASEAALHLPHEGRLAIIGEADAAVGHAVPNNPEKLLHALHFHRALKTPYELACMRRASLLGARGHVAAAHAFLQGASEAEIHSVYLLASDMTDRELPYANIVGLNEHAAVLHYQFQDRERPAEHRTLLVDGGADVHGYASDITRTWTTDEGDFQALIDAMDHVELALVDQVRAGTDYKHIHLDAHRRIAGVLSEHRIVNVSAEAALAEGLTHTFFPHGIGHFLGLQVHDVGALIGDEDGTRIERPDGHRYLRLTRPLEAGMVVTIEPGLYFIPSLLKKLEQSPQSAMVNWGKVQAMLPFGGIRIEDDVVCTDGAPENMTRDAFATLEP